MKLRKLYALLMALVMLVGMIPAAQAELCSHQYDWRYPDGMPTNCQDERLCEMYCTICGEVVSSYTDRGEHTSTSWYWDGDPPTNCQDRGIQIMDCALCGETYTEREVYGSHSWGSFITVEAATCETAGWKASYCTVCGDRGETQEIPALGHDWGSWSWAHEEPSCEQGAWQVRECARCGQMEDKWVEASNHKWGPETLETVANCITPGVVSVTCSVCGAKESWETDYGSHQWGEWQADQAATCTEGGTEKKICGLCGQEQTRNTDALGHSYGNWRDEYQPTCIERGLEYKTCSRCGDTQWRYKATVDHSFGEWYVVREPQVGAPGLEQRDCVYECGTNEQREIPALSEDEIPQMWCNVGLVNDPANGTHFVPGETVHFSVAYENPSDYDVVNARVHGLVQDSSEHNDGTTFVHVLHIDGGNVAAHETGSFAMSYTVTEADAARGAIYAEASFWADLPSGIPVWEYITVPLLTVPCGGESGADIPALHCGIAVSNTPANGTHFVCGETIRFTVSFTNPAKSDLTNVTILGSVADGADTGAQVLHERRLANLVPLVEAAYTTGSFNFSYTVTAEDAARGAVYAHGAYRANTTEGIPCREYITGRIAVACGSGDLPGGAEPPVNPDIGGDSILNGEDPTPNGTVTSGVSVVKSVTNTPANGLYYVPGEEIQFFIRVYNNLPEMLDGVVLTDPLSADFYFESPPIPAGDSVSRPLAYTVTELDAVIGSVTNYAYAVAYLHGEPQSLTSNSVTVPCGFPDQDGNGQADDPFGIHTALEITKEVESLPLNGSYYQEGETVAYKITYVNAGESVLYDVSICDPLAGLAEIASAEMLNPGESRICRLNYTVTEKDVLWGYVKNTAVGWYTVQGHAHSVNSNSVTVDTNGVEDVWIVLPPEENGEEPDYFPETGWGTIYYPMPEGGNPPFGTIDIEALQRGDSYCVRSITGRDNVSVSYETSFCTEHADAQASALMMAQAAATPEMQMQSAAYAVALWRSEVEALYQEIIEACDPAAKAVVMTEYIRFLTDAANYEAVLKVLYPDQPALVAQKMAALWEDKCVTLCYEAHANASVRKDSLLSVTAAAGASSPSCSCAVTSAEPGKKTSTQSYCAVHGFPFGMMDALLQGKDTAEAWTMVRQIWGVELKNAYNQLAARLGENSPLAIAEYNALTQWMMAREAALIALYPDHPEIVAQTMVKCIMDRVNELCQVSK